MSSDDDKLAQATIHITGDANVSGSTAFHRETALDEARRISEGENGAGGDYLNVVPGTLQHSDMVVCGYNQRPVTNGVLHYCEDNRFPGQIPPPHTPTKPQNEGAFRAYPDGSAADQAAGNRRATENLGKGGNSR